MRTSLPKFALVGAAALVVVGLASSPSQAGPPLGAVGRTYRPYFAPINPNYQVYPGMSIRQYAYNVRVLSRAYSQVPPYLLGYNPYPVYNNYGPVYPYSNPLYQSALTTYPSFYNPYTYLMPSYVNPYSP
jgi:hypothetical protein